VFGIENYRAVLCLQGVIDLGSCLLIAGFVGRLSSPRAAMLALWLSALCPFTANYTAIPLTETLAIFCVALALYAFAVVVERPSWPALLLLAFAWSYGAMLRPEGAILAVVLFLALLFYGRKTIGQRRALRWALCCAAISLLPFIPWTIRNWRTFHVFQPLAPRSASDPGEFVPWGFERWTKTWQADFVSTYEVYWNIPDEELDISKLPARAFDDRRQYEQTMALAERYNLHKIITPEMDRDFAVLASERIHKHPIRYYAELPVLRVLDMWLRPRIGTLNLPLRWWRYSDHRGATLCAVLYGLLNLGYLVLAAAGVRSWPKYRGAMIAYVLVRTTLLATLTAPETRYTIEFFPMIIAFAAQALASARPTGFVSTAGARAAGACEFSNATPVKDAVLEIAHAEFAEGIS
jgi:4-amino-4-deoxy-L-arabinose transferase-like glycosyltransferase